MILLQLVDESGNTIGHAEKIAAHEEGGLLHRAVSVVLIDDQGRILVQRRAASKYHFAGKWANAGCTHPLSNESPVEAGRRALRNELGIDTSLTEIMQFIYDAHDPESGYTEREYDHVLFGEWSGPVIPNESEVSETEWLTPSDLRARLEQRETDYAHWFRQILIELQNLPTDRLAPHPRLRLFVFQLSEEF
jgi:isopentenyl-diphosphate Delta-isomerase